MSIKNISNENRLLCIVFTSKKTINKRCPAIYDTWAKNCTKVVFACNCKGPSINETDKYDDQIMKKIDILHLPIKESYNLMAKKPL